jgi:hypothetical protein
MSAHDENCWEFIQHPLKPGWYAIIQMYDSQEGWLPSAGHWDGKQWTKGGDMPVACSKQTFADEESAFDFASDHTP